MNSSNSFNICPRCGNSNALNAKYCSRCGGQLKVPEEPVVCHKCHTHNTPMANFCRNCGTPLKVGSETKICPRCGKEVSADKAICQCGYSFVTYQQTAPSTEKAVDVSVLRVKTTETTRTTKTKSKVYSNKGGRGWAIAGILLVLLLAYFIMAPFHLYKGDTGEVAATLRPEFLVNADKGFINNESATAYGYDFVDTLVLLIKSLTAAEGKVSLDSIKWVGAEMMMLYLTVIFVLTAFVHLIVCIVRSFTAKRSKKMNIYFLVMAIITTLVVGMILLFTLVAAPESGFFAKVASWFALSEGMSLGYAIWAIPGYFWFFFLYSLCAKARRLKEAA